MSSDKSSEGILYLLVGGPVVLLWGLRTLNEKRLLENTPRSKIRSAAMGLVELSGRAIQRKALASPVSSLDCCWWNCQVQEYQQSGKNSRWVTIKQTSSLDLFYLEDETGKVLVNPQNAELHVPSHTFDLTSSTRSQLEPVLMGWGINATGWFGGVRRMRVLEQIIMNQSPLFLLGELVNTDTHLEDRQARFLARLRTIKADPSKMAGADINHDGTVDADEWDAFRAEQEEEFLKEEMRTLAQQPDGDKLLLKAPSDKPFVVSTEPEEQLLRSFQWIAPLAVGGVVGLCGLGVYLGVLNDWNPLFIVGLLVGGFVISLFMKQFNFSTLSVRR